MKVDDSGNVEKLPRLLRLMWSTDSPSIHIAVLAVLKALETLSPLSVIQSVYVSPVVKSAIIVHAIQDL